MHVVRTIADWRTHRSNLRGHHYRVGFVPTMGALHAGHVSLVARARTECDVVVVSIFVNPAQFNNAADLSAYPRTEDEDAAVLNAAGVDYLFAPSTKEIYPTGFASTINVGAIAQPLEGATRGFEHFQGVATVVAKLLNIVHPDAAYFGQKDAQQLLVVKQLVRDLNMPVDIIACDIVREPDGLALSSRNMRLNTSARTQAVGLSAALLKMCDMIVNGELRSAMVLAEGYAVLAKYDILPLSVDYLAVVTPDRLQPLEVVSGDVLIAVAAYVDGVRLIDNITVRVPLVAGQNGDIVDGSVNPRVLHDTSGPAGTLS